MAKQKARSNDMEYRAAYLGETVLTGPEHAHMSDSDLIAEACRELDRQDPHHATDSDGVPLAPRQEIRIGMWRAR